MLKSSILLLSLFSLGGCDAGAQVIDWSGAIQKTDAVFSEFNTDHTPGCAIGVIHNGAYILEKGYGMSNLEHGIPISRTSVFRTGSLAKQFTDAALGVLVERGDIDLDADIHEYLPDLALYEDKVTIRQMIAHLSGIPDYEGGEGVFIKEDGKPFRFGNEDYYTIQEFYDHAKHVGLRTPPETEFHYSNTAYFFLSQVIEKVSAEPIKEFAEREIFKKIGMDKSFFNTNVNGIIPERADGYQVNEDGVYEINMTNLSYVGDGGVYTSLEDFIKWDQNFYDNKIGKGDADFINMIETPHSFFDREKSGYAWGMNVTSHRGERLVSHTGSWVGFRAVYSRFSDLKLSFVGMCNAGNESPLRDFMDVRDAYLDALGVLPLNKKGE
ncbi:MAG: serine hydrolase domain-containing protein [Sphingomonadales bacterium]|jgi:CubicO group peptidase (beta-lactamase class C family)